MNKEKNSQKNELNKKKNILSLNKKLYEKFIKNCIKKQVFFKVNLSEKHEKKASSIHEAKFNNSPKKALIWLFWQGFFVFQNRNLFK